MRTLHRFAPVLLALLVVLTSLGLPNRAAAPAFASSSPPMRSASFSGAAPGGQLDLSGYLLVNSNPSFDYNGGSITIEAWVKRAGTNRIESLVGNGRGANLWLGISATGQISFTPLGAVNLIDGSAAIPANVWTHIAVVYQSNVSRAYYIDGMLDKFNTTPSNNPALANASITQPLDIASDRDNMANVYNYTGQMDELRIWNTARTPTQIASGLFTMASGPQTNLAGAWNFNGSPADVTGVNMTTIQGTGVSYLTDGALPRDLSVPQVSSAMTLDGSCGPTEYAGSIDVGIFSTTISIQHTATDLWICMDDIGSSVLGTEVYLDPQNTQLNPPQPEHIRLTLPTSATVPFASVGDGNGGFTTSSALDSQWAGKNYITATDFPKRSAEFRVAASMLGGWDHLMGLAININRSAPASWPSLMFTQRPVSWAKVSLLSSGPARTFSGSVVYHPKSSLVSDQFVGGASVNLIGYDDSGNEALVVTTTTNQDGTYSLSSTDGFPSHRLEAGIPPKGMEYSTAAAGAVGTVVDAHTIDFGDAVDSVYAGDVFKLSDAQPRPLDTTNGPIFLILGTQSMLNSGALDDFINYKFRLGFTVVSQSIESIEANFTTGSRQDRIRAYEQSLFNSYGNRFQYALFVGSTDKTLPPAHLWPYASSMNKSMCADPTQTGFKYSDWYFVDLSSNFDSNKNGCLMDGSWAKSPSPGYTPDSPFGFSRNVAVGRIPFDTSSIVRSVLQNSMDFERQAQVYKTRAMLSLSMLAMKGYDAYGNPCYDWTANHCAPPNTSANFDMSVLGEMIRKDTFVPLNYQVQTYYENDPAASGGMPVASSQTIDPTVIQNDLNTNLYGFINMDGHGNYQGVYRVNWSSDLNGNGKPNYPAEMGTGDMFTTSELSAVGAKNSQGGIYYFSACLNADPTQQGNIAATILSDKVGVASIAAYNIITVGPWNQLTKDGLAQNTDYRVISNLMGKNLRLGDALWKDLQDEYRSKDPGVKTPGSGLVGMGLFGDPTLSYQGNPGAGAALAPWSMARRESTGQAYFPLPGPQIPNQVWQYQGSAVAPTVGRAAPVVSANGDVIASSGSSLVVLSNGTPYQILPLTAPAYGTPALAADGTVYAADTMGNLYAFSVNTSPTGTHKRSQRWKIALGGTTLTNPTISPDGTILIGYASTFQGYSKMALVRPDGNIQTTYQVLGDRMQVAISAGADRSLFVSTSDSSFPKGLVTRYDPYCNGLSLCNGDTYLQPNVFFSTAPLLAYEYVYAGDESGKVFQFDHSLQQVIHAYSTGSKITAGPVSGPSGQVLVAAQNGKVYSLSTNLSLRWMRDIGSGSAITSVPAFSDDSLYLTGGGYLWALNPNSGATLWKRSLANSASGSVAVGYGRQLFLQTSDGKITAFGENWLSPVYNLTVQPAKLRTIARNVVSWSLTLPDFAVAGLGLSPQAIQPASNVAGLLVERSKDGANWEMSALLPPDATSYTDLDITPEAGYQYRVQLIDSTGQNSDYATSDPVQALPALPSAPVLNNVTAFSSGELLVSWSTPANSVVTSYRVETSTVQAGPFMPIATVSSASLGYADSGLAPGSLHYYRIFAINDMGESAPSNIIGSASFSQDLPTPTSPSATLKADDTIHITWSGRPDGASAVVEVLIFGSDTYQVLGTVSVDSFDYAPGEPSIYGFRVRFVKGSHDSPYASTASVEIAPEIEYSVFLPVTVR